MEVFSRRFTGSGGVPLTIQKGSAAIGALARALPITSATAYRDLVVAGATACGAIFAAFHARHAICLHVEPRFETPGQECHSTANNWLYDVFHEEVEWLECLGHEYAAHGTAVHTEGADKDLNHIDQHRERFNHDHDHTLHRRGAEDRKELSHDLHQVGNQADYSRQDDADEGVHERQHQLPK
jgi:hypothetical protein